MPGVFQLHEWIEDSTNTVLARIAVHNGSGAETGNDGEGSFVTQADVSSITYSIFDKDGDTPDTAIATGTLDKTVVILDSVVTSKATWTKDAYGYNFKHSFGVGAFPTGRHRYEVEYILTLTDGSVYPGIFKAPARPLRTS